MYNVRCVYNVNKNISVNMYSVATLNIIELLNQYSIVY